MAAIIALASMKGGVSKTTLSVALGTHLALEGLKVRILDGDLNQHASKFGRLAKIPGFAVTDAINEDNLSDQIKAALGSAEYIFIDLPAGSSNLAFRSMGLAHFVLIPAQRTLLDSRDAARTIKMVRDAEEMRQRPLPHAVIWTRVPPGTFESRSERHIRQELEQQDGVQMMNTVLTQRASYQMMFIAGEAPRQRNADDPAAQNIAAIAQELLGRLTAGHKIKAAE